MAYQISAKNILTDSDGKAILITNKLISVQSVSGAIVHDLPPDYFDNKFPTYGGKTSGYMAGGFSLSGSSPYGNSNVIDTFPFASDTNATDHGDLAQSRKNIAGASASTHGYNIGGLGHGGTITSNIDRFPFSSNSGQSDVGNLAVSSNGQMCGHNDDVKGFGVGGRLHSPSLTTQDGISSFPFASDANATNVGTLVSKEYNSCPVNSTTHGYTVGGRDVGTSSGIQKFPFAISSGVSVMVGSYYASELAGGVSSETHGYGIGGNPDNNVIRKFSLANDADIGDAADIADALFVTDGGGVVGSSSRNNGYGMGGMLAPGSANQNIIQKFPFATDANATDVGDLVNARSLGSGHQV